MKIRILCMGLMSISILTACTQTKLEETSKTEEPAKQPPNILIFYVDDLGYGDLSSYGATRVATPNIDQLAANGIRFTDAHASSATCTPSRYSLLTGEYAFRNNASVLPGDAPLIINENQTTLPSLLQQHGYVTGVVGKWHLGLGKGDTALNWNEEIKPGPNQIGFNYSYLLPATGDRVPSVYVENGYVENLDTKNDPLTVSYQQKVGMRPTGTENPELLRQQADPQHSDTIINGISRIGFMEGGKSAEWIDEDFYRVFTDKATQFISSQDEKPFFLFFSFHDIHVPRLPNAKFVGSTDMGPRGDAITQVDFITGEIVDYLRKTGQLDNTIIVFTSDNGPVLNDGYEDDAVALIGNHKPAGPLRGGKYSAFEAGTRVPTILHYPNEVKPGVSHSLMSQVDLYASLGALASRYSEIDIDASPIDSENHLNAWLDHTVSGREYLLQQSATFSLRHNQWKYIAPEEKTHPWITRKGIESGLKTSAQLYNLKNDIAEQVDLSDQHVDKVAHYQKVLDAIMIKTAEN